MTGPRAVLMRTADVVSMRARVGGDRSMRWRVCSLRGMWRNEIGFAEEVVEGGEGRAEGAFISGLWVCGL